MYLFMTYVFLISQEFFAKKPIDYSVVRKPLIIQLFQSEMNVILDDYMTKALYHLENKYKILSRTERQIFKEHKPVTEDKKT